MKPCKQPYCPEIVEKGFCEEHTPKSVRSQGLANEGMYNTKRWRRLRTKKLRLNPICEICDKELATDVDHIQGVNEGGAKWSMSNLQALCKSCHSKKTNREVRERVY